VPNDFLDWDMQLSPVAASVGGTPAVIGGGKMGYVYAMNAASGALLWKTPVGVHNGHDNDGLLTEHLSPAAHMPLPRAECVEPGGFGGIESQLATNGSTTFAAVNDMPMLYLNDFGAIDAGGLPGLFRDLGKAGGEMVAVNQDTGAVDWDDKLPSSPYGAATVTNNVVFTTTYNGDLYAFNAATGAILLHKPMSAGTNAPVAIDGDYVIAGAGVAHSSAQRPLIIAYKLGATGKLPDTVSP
jgi:outer membrane protein assembly factor BamB